MPSPVARSSGIRAEFRFYAGLNDFLPGSRRQRTVIRHFRESPAIKDPIEAFGVPHPEVGRIVVNGRTVDFTYRLADGDRVAVYPGFTRIDPGCEGRLRPPAPGAFVLDVHLGALARRMRLLGLDTLYGNDLDDHHIVAIAAGEGRVVLTRDRKLLCHGEVLHGAWLRATDPEAQVTEVLDRFAPAVAPFSRCLVCNGRLVGVAKAAVAQELPPYVLETAPRVLRCVDCRRLFWPGSHHARLRARVARYLARLG
ncbi:MAG: Mut7-C RNAse domain-containing protein [Gammaproteobacteria bacterium]|nr:Mut7-C RNAse domain-containing protein [Gammaproteobacteria bacterium]